MFYLLFFILLLTIAVMLGARSFKLRQKKIIDELYEQWGDAKKDGFNFSNIAIYNRVVKDDCYHQLSEQTKNDIDFDELFCLVDRTTSRVGQQFLYNALSKPSNDIANLEMLGRQADFFIKNEKERNAILHLLMGLNTNPAFFISTLLKDDLPGKPRWYKVAKFYLVIVGAMVLLSIKYPILLIWLMLPFTINMFIHYRNKSITGRFSTSFPQLNILIGICKKISESDIPFESSLVKKSISELATIQRKGILVSFDGAGFKDEFTQLLLYLFELIKAFFLIEFFTFHNLINEIKNKQADILKVFNYVGNVDLALSIASLRAGHLKTCEPFFLPPEKQLGASGLYHPLIPDCIANDIIVQSKSILITGSNMSGKTTFLRSIALNSILAQTIYTCFADSFNTPVLKLHSSIRIDDNLLDGKSFYFEEVNVMATLVSKVKEQAQNIFILDEVFKGTNTIERIASAKAILSFLNKNNNIVFVSTHDVELAALLSDEYELYHFAETINEAGLHFDHTLKTGPLTTRNAIRILEMYNYPNEITDEAKIISEKLSA